MTATQLIARAAGLLGYKRAGMTLPADVLNEGLDALNDLVSSWRIQSNLVFTITDALFTLVPSQQDYAIGPSGANFSAPRPTFIKQANLVLTTATPVIRVPIQILLDSDEWGAIKARGIQTSVPLYLYYEPTVPNGVLHLWPVPQTAYQLEIFTWAQLGSFADLTTDYSLAPGYENALKYNLALELAPLLPNKMAKVQGGRDMFDDVRNRARQYKAEVKSHNITVRRIFTDVPLSLGGRGQPDFNWRTGNLGGNR